MGFGRRVSANPVAGIGFTLVHPPSGNQPIAPSPPPGGPGTWMVASTTHFRRYLDVESCDRPDHVCLAFRLAARCPAGPANGHTREQRRYAGQGIRMTAGLETGATKD